jgi:hypothetical protein
MTIKLDQITKARPEAGSAPAWVSVGGAVAGESSSNPATTDPNRLYAGFDLGAVRGVKQFGELLEPVTRRPGTRVKPTLGVEAERILGSDDTTQRIVRENASNLGASASEFE